MVEMTIHIVEINLTLHKRIKKIGYNFKTDKISKYYIKIHR